MPNVHHPRFGIVVIGASLGGLEALRRLLSPLPAEFPAPIVVVRHVRCGQSGCVVEMLLGGHTLLGVKEAEAGDLLRPGTVYLAPPCKHLLVESGGTLALSEAPKVNLVRPSADVLFRSAADAYGQRALAVVLTGSLGDGAAGVRAVKGAGGTVLAQDEATSEAFGMPSAAIGTGCVDFVLPLGTISAALTSLVMVRGGAHLFGIPMLSAA
jgi:two-component system chemotaxis response regulator CheB